MKTAFASIDRGELERASGGVVRQAKYLKRNPLRQWLIARFLDTICRWVEASGARTLGDAGAGEGFVSRRINDLPVPPGGRVIRLAMDIEPGVLRVARHLNPGLPVARADARRCPLRDDALDLVLCNEVLEHVPDPQLLLAELCRVAPLQIISVPHEPLYRWSNMAAGANWARRGDDPDHVNRWRPDQLRAFLSRHTHVVEMKTSFPWSMALCRSR